MKKVLTAVLFVSSWFGASAQPVGIETSSRYDDQGNAVIEVSYHDGNIYDIVLELYDVENLIADRFTRTRMENRGRLALLKPRDPQRNVNFRYRYRYISGSSNPKRVDTIFVYRLPFSLSDSREPLELYNVYDRYTERGDENSVNWKAFQFFMNSADTVYAARKGEVIRVVDMYDPLPERGEVSMTTHTNEIYVEHTDGTIARYNVLEKGSITVKPGDTVFPDTPIALAGTLDGERYQVQFSLYYQTDNLSRINNLSDYKIKYHYIDPVFATTDGETILSQGRLYRPVSTEEMVTREMTKREIRARSR